MAVFLKNQNFSKERDLYNESNLFLDGCHFEGIEDGESALKETKHIKIVSSFFDLRYPLWHSHIVFLEACTMSMNCRAALWYATNISIYRSTILGIKALRESSNILLIANQIQSIEFAWRCKHLKLFNNHLESEYAFFESQNIIIDNLIFKGKYSFQYTKNLIIKNSYLHTKDAFWHAKKVIVYDSVIEGEYLGWYSDRLTLIRCHIKGTQPFCYCKNLKLIDCIMENTDLCFENSTVHATINSDILSIKNPTKGVIKVVSYQTLIMDSPNHKVKIITNKKDE